MANKSNLTKEDFEILQKLIKVEGGIYNCYCALYTINVNSFLIFKKIFEQLTFIEEELINSLNLSIEKAGELFDYVVSITKNEEAVLKKSNISIPELMAVRRIGKILVNFMLSNDKEEAYDSKLEKEWLDNIVKTQLLMLEDCIKQEKDEKVKNSLFEHKKDLIFENRDIEKLMLSKNYKVHEALEIVNPETFNKNSDTGNMLIEGLINTKESILYEPEEEIEEQIAKECFLRACLLQANDYQFNAFLLAHETDPITSNSCFKTKEMKMIERAINRRDSDRKQYLNNGGYQKKYKNNEDK